MEKEEATIETLSQRITDLEDTFRHLLGTLKVFTDAYKLPEPTTDPADTYLGRFIVTPILSANDYHISTYLPNGDVHDDDLSPRHVFQSNELLGDIYEDGTMYIVGQYDDRARMWIMTKSKKCLNPLNHMVMTRVKGLCGLE